jgi:multiple sugar transport system ATP-binding protein
MAFGLRVLGSDKAEIEKKVKKAAEILQLTPLLDRLPKALSGGQRQRVAIGRAIVKEPEVFLFDEPLSNLDAALRVQTRLEIAKLHHDLGSASMIYVTHDQVEAMTLANKIVLLHTGALIQERGSVAQVGTPMNLYHRPASLFVAEFIGSPKMNLLPGKLVSAGPAMRGWSGRPGVVSRQWMRARAGGAPCRSACGPSMAVADSGGAPRPRAACGAAGRFVAALRQRGSGPAEDDGEDGRQRQPRCLQRTDVAAGARGTAPVRQRRAGMCADGGVAGLGLVRA